jgi:hypothetical protein
MSVEFKLFDFMTLKQFMISFGLLLLSFILFFLLPGPWKVLVPLMIVIFGGIIIFVPFNGEPFQEFVGSYMEAMISPQRRIWNKKGVIVQSAYNAAKRYQFGNDPKDDKNDFRFNNAQTVKIGEDSTELDTEESKFLHNEGQEGNPSYAPPQKKNDVSPISYEQSGTRVSPKSIQANVNLDQLTSPNRQAEPIPEVAQNQIHTETTQKHEEAVSINIDPNIKPANTQSESNTQPQISINLDQIPTKEPEPQVVVQQTSAQRAKAAEEIVSRNYIFGNIEDEKAEGIPGAYISLQQNNTELENILSNAGGDFQTHYEYPAGEYILDILVDGKAFNTISLHHDPVDPIPLTIRSRFVKEEEIVAEYLTTEGPAFKEDGVFVGSYDSTSFNLGQDYSDLEEPQDIFLKKEDFPAEALIDEQSQEIAQPAFLSKESQISQPAVSFIQPESQPSNDPTPPSDQPFFTLPHQQEEAQQNFNHIEPVIEQPAYDENFEKNIISSADNLDANQNTSYMPDPSIGYDTAQIEMTPEVLNPAYTQITNEIDFKILPDITAQMDVNLIGIPNTINGIVYDANSLPLGSVLINISDDTKKIVRTMATDPQGVFYSYSPFPSGRYHIEFMRQGALFMRYYVELTGYPVNAKTVQSIQNVS